MVKIIIKIQTKIFWPQFLSDMDRKSCSVKRLFLSEFALFFSHPSPQAPCSILSIIFCCNFECFAAFFRKHFQNIFRCISFLLFIVSALSLRINCLTRTNTVSVKRHYARCLETLCQCEETLCQVSGDTGERHKTHKRGRLSSITCGFESQKMFRQKLDLRKCSM